MAGPLVVNPDPFEIEADPLGKIYINGIISGLGLWQSAPVAGNPNSLLDLSNGQLFFQKTQGFFQFYIQGGGYSLPSLGTSYLRMNDTTDDFYGPVPVAFIKLSPNENFSIIVGKLFTLFDLLVFSDQFLSKIMFSIFFNTAPLFTAFCKEKQMV